MLLNYIAATKRRDGGQTLVIDTESMVRQAALVAVRVLEIEAMARAAEFEIAMGWRAH